MCTESRMQVFVSLRWFTSLISVLGIIFSNVVRCQLTWHLLFLAVKSLPASNTHASRNPGFIYCVTVNAPSAGVKENLVSFTWSELQLQVNGSPVQVIYKKARIVESWFSLWRH